MRLPTFASAVICVAVLACAAISGCKPPAAPVVPPASPTVSQQVLTGYTAIERSNARLIAELALRTKATDRVTPIPLDFDPAPPRHGALYTPYLLSALAVRDARAHGRPAESRPLGNGIADEKPVFVAAAYPIVCGRRTSRPIALRLVGNIPSTSPSRREATRLEPAVSDAAGIARLLPGEDLPRGSLVSAFRTPLGDESVEIDYGPPFCPGQPKSLAFPITRERRQAPPPPIVLKLPSDLSSSQPIAVAVAAVVAPDGRLAFPGIASGPLDLAEAAENAVRPLTGLPDIQNGLALPALALRQVVFTSTGEPPPPPRSPIPQSAVAELVAASKTRATALALEMAKRGPVRSIPFDAPGEIVHAFGYDNSMVGYLRARTLLSENPGLTPDEFSRASVSGQLIVAVPLVCGTRRVAPIGIDAAFGQTAPRAPTRTLSGAALNLEFPEIHAPSDSFAAFFGTPLERTIVTITYAEPACPLGSTKVTLPLPTSTPPRPTKGPIVLPFPDGVDDLPSPTNVQVDAVVDEEGHVHSPNVQAPVRYELVQAAERAVAVAEWEPRRINGVAVTTSSGTVVQFTGTGQRLSASPYVLQSVSLPERGLTRETSRCAIADDREYGSITQPIPVGGDDWRGVARERAYLGALRGPDGQGVGYRAVGAVFDPASRTFRDVYELIYAGNAEALRIFLDEYHAAPLKAPVGFTCAAPLPSPPADGIRVLLKEHR